jgi:hypothetical protein
VPNAEQVDKKMERRAAEVARSSYTRVIETHACYDTGGGVVITENRYGAPTVAAHYFKPRQLKKAFKEEVLKTAHERIAVLDTLRDLIAAEKAEKVAPHNLKKGDIIAEIWGSTMQGVNFHVVGDVPHPRKVSLIHVGSRYVSGDFMGGNKVPNIDPGEIPEGEGATYMVEMRGDTAWIKMGDFVRASRWSGKPVMVYSD